MSARFWKPVPLRAFFLLMQFVGSHFAAAVTPEACSLLSPSEVAKITGDEASIVANNVQPTGSVCVYGPKRRAGTSASVRIQAFESAAGAQEQLKRYGDVEGYRKRNLLKPGDKMESDKVAGMPALFQIVQGAASMYVVRGNLLVAAGVNRASSDGKIEPNRERSRSLLAAAIGKLGG